MPIFGLVWVASWVSCFFSSSQDLLRAPSALAYVLPIEAPYSVSGAHAARLSAFSRDRVVSVLPLHPVQPGVLVQTVPQAEVSLKLALADAILPASVTSLNFLGAFKNLFSELQKFTAIHRAPPVVVIQPEPERAATAKGNQVHPSRLGLGQCEPIVQPGIASGGASSSRSQPPSFQVKIKDTIVGFAPNQQQATKFAHHLEAALNDANAAPLEQLQPAMINGIPVGKLGDRVLFTVDQQVADQGGCNPELLAIRWINALRTALAESPLALADAQAKMYSLQETGQRFEGIASWYGPYFHGRRTATGETFNQNDFTAAHPSLPFGTYLRVTNIANGTAVIVRVNDRGPYFENRTLDLSREAARCLDSERHGVVSVEAEIMQPMKSMDASRQAIARRL